MTQAAQSRASRLDELGSALGARHLVWFGISGTDAAPLLDYEQFAASFSLIAPVGASTLAVDVALEQLRGSRPDFNTYSTDHDFSPERLTLASRLRESLQRPSVLLPYRPARFLDGAYLPALESVTYLGLGAGQQVAFEHKPWVESKLRALGVAVVPWRYASGDVGPLLAEVLRDGPAVVRPERSNGGEGIVLVESAVGLGSVPQRDPDAVVAVAPYLDGSLPLNVAGCVFHDGVTVHAPSVQLIGIGECTDKRFGYCGNDFAAIRSLEAGQLDALESLVVRTGTWLRSMGYLGAFGIDALLHKGRLLVAEINPRFQGSSCMSASLDAALDRPTIYDDHLAAYFGLRPPVAPPLRELAPAQPARAQVVVYAAGGGRIRRLEPAGRASDLEMVPEAGMTIAAEGVLFKISTDGPVTVAGADLRPDILARISSLKHQLFSGHLPG